VAPIVASAPGEGTPTPAAHTGTRAGDQACTRSGGQAGAEGKTSPAGSRVRLDRA
jgi:hypothetical protein